jgi:hypothetical protein
VVRAKNPPDKSLFKGHREAEYENLTNTFDQLRLASRLNMYLIEAEHRLMAAYILTTKGMVNRSQIDVIDEYYARVFAAKIMACYQNGRCIPEDLMFTDQNLLYVIFPKDDLALVTPPPELFPDQPKPTSPTPLAP